MRIRWLSCVALSAHSSAFYHDQMDVTDPKQREVTAHRLIAKMPTIAAWCYKYSVGQPFMYPRNDLSYAENFLHMMFGTPCEEYKPNPVLANAMDKIFILHADHEQNASTSTVRLAGSTGANPYACIASGIAALWGPAHGGANEAVLDMLAEIGDVANIDTFIEKAKDKNDPFRLMGFGHRVYKNFDPRAKVMSETAHQVLSELGLENDPSAEDRPASGTDSPGRRILCAAPAVPERRLLLRHHPEGHWYPDLYVYRDFRDVAHHRLVLSLERNGQRQLPHRSSAPALHRLAKAGLPEKLSGTLRSEPKSR